MKLYDTERSGNCYKVRLMLSLLGMSYEPVPVDLAQGDQRTPGFLALNPRGQVPVLEDGAVRVWDSMAILVYLARRYGGETWLPLEAQPMAEVMQWLAVSENEILYGLARARAIRAGRQQGDPAPYQQTGRQALGVLEQRLARHEWLALDRLTIADVACYPYVALAPESGVPLDEYPAVRAWIARIQALPGYTPLPGKAAAHASTAPGAQRV
ncbi:MAG: glutathione S-transferase family protein [Gammaproteobacteria bacterium]|nr:glutathione S-transferase family protein [Gammaproteobacteria bacterium]